MPRPYVKVLLITAAITVVLTSIVNYVVDPYGVYRFVDHDGFNRHKPKAGVNGRLSKPYNVQRVQPKTLLLGNSRVEGGLDPDSQQWPRANVPVYNMALPATGIATALDSLRYVLRITKPTVVVTGIDVVDFLVDDRPGSILATAPNEVAAPHREVAYENYLPLQKFKDVASTLFSLNALADSLLTVTLQGRKDQPDLTAHGFSPMREYEGYARAEGYEKLFLQVDTTYFTNYLRGPKHIYSAGTRSSVELDQLRQLIRLCRSSNMTLLLYIHPSHAHVMEGYRLTGLWPAFEEWKRAIVTMVADEGRRSPGAGSVELWDFSGYNEITTEQVPATSEKGRFMRWYWDPGHYNSQVGDLVLAQMLRNGSTDPARPVLGVRLDQQNLERHLADIRIQQKQYETSHPDDVARLERLARTIGARLKTPVPAVQ